MPFRARAVAAAGRLPALAVAVILLSTSVASADDHLGGEPAAKDGASIEAAPLIAGVLRELGIEEDEIVALVGTLRPGVSQRVDAMLVEGVVTEAQVTALGEHLDDGTFHHYVPDLVDDARVRRDEFREAARAALDHLGIAVPEGVPLHEILRENGLTPPELEKVLAELGIELPPPPPPLGRPPPPPPDDSAPGDAPPPPLAPPPLPPSDDSLPPPPPPETVPVETVPLDTVPVETVPLDSVPLDSGSPDVKLEQSGSGS